MIEWSRVRELRDEIGAEDFGDVVEIFLDEVQEVIDRLKSDAGSADLASDLHFLKGSAMSLGFKDFSKLCHDGEIAAANGQAANVDLVEVVGGFETSKQHFLQEIDTQLTA